MDNIRQATHWHMTEVNGHRIRWVDGTEFEGRRIASIETGRDHQPMRIDSGTGELIGHLTDDDESGLPRGLVVFGRCKWDRPTAETAARLLPEFADELLTVG